MYIREAVIIAVVAIFIGGLIWTLKPQQRTKPKFYFALALALLGLVAFVMSLIRGDSAGLRSGLGLAMLWGGVSVLTATARKWQRIAGWSFAFLGLVLFMAH